ncbi:hypothetical protein BDQ17DRAFT_1258406 [Cyathus striatus]|nr:hypothetical protein BDQ17DRAFT_1258406 [Cyathus striatus]
MTGNPIYFFYEHVTLNANGLVGNPGDKHYQCYHGGQRILTITKAMRCCLSGLIGNLKTANEAMSQFYTILNNWPCSEGIMQDEIDIASGTVSLSESKASEFLQELEKKSENIHKAFAIQEE